MIRLRYTTGQRAGEMTGVEGALATIGRAPSCDVIVDDSMVSAVHATLEQVPAGYIVTDQQSSNGTLVNGLRIFRSLMRVGDELTLGSTGLKVESSDGFAATLYADGTAQPPPPASLPPLSPATGQPRERKPSTPRIAAERPTMMADTLVAQLVHPQKGLLRTTPVPPKGLTIGRHPECGLVVDDGQVSALHCKLTVGPNGAVLTDLGSSNGTFVGDERLPRDVPRPLGPDESARVGSHLLRVRAARPAQIIPTLAPAMQPAAVSRFFIDVVEGAPTQRVEVRAGTPLTIGRLPTATIVITDPQASGAHCEVTLSGDGLSLADVGSRNGTFFGERRVTGPTKIRHGDVFRVGAVKLRATVQRPSERAADLKPAPVPPSAVESQHLPKVMRGARLRFVDGSRAGTEMAVVLVERVVTSLGRASDNDVVLDDRSVSAHHCAITATEQGFVLRDLGSSNGTFVNSERVSGERALSAGDLIRVGLEAVCELALEGAARNTMSVHAEGAVVGALLPRFVLRGAVLRQHRCVVGRDPECDLFLDDPRVARRAAEIEFVETRFVARPLAAGGLVVNGRAVGEASLSTGDVLTVGGWQLRVEVSGARLAIHENALHVSGNYSWAREAELPAQAAVVPEAVPTRPGAIGRQVFSTIFATDAASLESLAPKRAPKKQAPKWKATSDLLVDRTRSGAALIGVGAAAVIVALLVSGPRDHAFLDGELARGHDSVAFADAARAHGLSTGCAACHTPMKAVAPARCQSCHTGFEPRRGPSGHDHVAAGLTCTQCHDEHRGAARGSALVARASCANAGCHDAKRPPHQKLQSEPKTPFVVAVHMAAPGKMELPKGDPHAVQEKLHEIHAGVKHRCMACHTAADGVSKGVASTACFRCHDAPAVQAQLTVASTGARDLDCAGCHGGHEQTLARVAEIGPRWTGGVSPARSGVAAATAVLALLLFVGGFAQLYFGRRIERVARLAREDDEDKPKPKAPSLPGAGAVDVELADPDKGRAAVKLKVNVNLDKCVGCANCVNACPTAVLEIVKHKSTIVAESNCTSCRACEEVCPSGALTMAPEGAPPRLIDLPDLDSHYQSNVPGLYLIGEAAGKSLVKNSANLGRVVVEHMLHGGLNAGDAARSGADVEVLCVGSGPGGLAAALTANRAGLRYAILEKERVYASTIQLCPKGKIFMAEPFDVKNISPLPIEDNVPKEELIRAWDEVLAREGIEIRLDEEVLDIQRQKDFFVVTTSRGIVTALRVVMAPGTRGRPRKLGVAGQELEKVSYMLVDAAEHRQQHLLVVGGGDSAVECAMALAAEPGNVVTLSYRRESFTRVKPRNLERLEQHAREGKVRLALGSQPQEIHPDHVLLTTRTDGVERVEQLRNDFVYCLLGADLPTVWLQQLGVRYVPKPEGWNPGPTDAISFGQPVAA
jgi:pSer/pThr/pTyr-binding forkhead associated (FHA) protein/thioredoxin reductase/ferredoxin